jgi:NADH-quinone oxidoreductase subunit D
VARFCDVFEEKWREYVDLLIDNHIFVQRTANVGVLPADRAIAWGCTGPMLRGSGVDWDLRRDEPYLVYPRLDFRVCVGRGEKGTLGDCWDRYFVRIEEMREASRMLRQLIRDIPDGPVLADVPRALRVPPGAGYVGIENPRGELGHYVVSEGGKVARRCRVRGPSFCNLSVLPELMGGTMLADAVAIIGSVDIVIGETDR